MYSKNVDLVSQKKIQNLSRTRFFNFKKVDDVIREYAINVSSELNNATSPTETSVPIESSSSSISSLADIKNQQHTCVHCPMQHFVNLCVYLNKFESNELIYDIIIDKLNKNLELADQNYLFNLIDEFQFEVAFSNKNATANANSLADINMYLVALLHRLCIKRQNQHQADIYSNNNKTGSDTNEDCFFNLMPIKQSFSSHATLSHSNSKKSQTMRRYTIASENRNNSAFVSKLTSNKLVEILRLKTSRSNSNSSSNGSINTNNPPINVRNNKLTHRVNNLAKTNSHNALIVQFRLNSTRKKIFNQIVTSGSSGATFMPPNADSAIQRVKRSSNDLRRLWKKMISEQIILIKMEKENQRMSSNGMREEDLESEDEVAGYETNYAEITPCLKEVDLLWDRLILGHSNEEPALKLVLKGNSTSTQILESKKKQLG